MAIKITSQTDFWNIIEESRAEESAQTRFLKDLQKQRMNFASGKTSPRAWVKETDGEFVVKFGKLLDNGKPLVAKRPTKDEMLKFLDLAEAQVKTDERLQKAIEAAYSGETVDEPKQRKPRRPKEEIDAEKAEKERRKREREAQKERLLANANKAGEEAQNAADEGEVPENA